MAINPCRDCGVNVPTEAKACSHCGAPTREKAAEGVLQAIVGIHYLAIVLFLLCLSFLFLVPARGIAVLHVYAAFGLMFLLSVVLATGLTYWYLKRRASNEKKKGQR
jgi:hypothetical protein